MAASPLMRLVLDTNVLVAAMRSPAGASARLVDAALSGRAVLVANAALFLEYEAVLTRPEHVSAAAVTAADVAQALDDLAAVVADAGAAWAWRPQLTDPDDEMVLAAAVNGLADALVTFEVRTFRGPAARFGIEVLTPSQAWSRVRP